jgi:tape measure domain-containing protein
MIDYGVKINVGGNAATVMGQLFTISQKLDAIMQKLNSMSSKLGDTYRRTGTYAQQATQKAESGFKRVSTAIGDARQKLDKLNFGFHGLGSKLAGLGLSIGAVDIGRRIINAGGTEEDALARLRFALKDEGKARAMLGDLKQMGRTMPIAISDIYKQAGFLAPVFKENTQKYLKMFADVVAGSGGDFGNIAFNFAQIKQLGRSQGIDLKQFAYQNIPIFEELSKLIGKSTEEILKMSTEGKISFDIVAKAFENMTKEGGIYFGAVEARAKTFRGQWQIIANKLEEIWVKFFEKARPYLQQFSDWVEKQIENFDELWPKIKLAGELIATYFSVRVLANFISGLNTIRKTLVAISSIKLTGVLTQFGTIGSILKGIGGPLAAILAFFGLINYGHGNASGQGYQAMSLEELKAERERLIALRDKPAAKDLKNVTDEEFANIHRNVTNKTSSDISSKIDEIDRVMKQKEAFSAFRDSVSGVNSAMGGISDVNTDLSPRGVSGNGGIKNFQITFNSPVVQIDDNHVDGEKYTPEQLGQTAAKEFVNILTQIAVQ